MKKYFDKSFKGGFTLAEMMIVLLIMSIVLAAMAPVMTRRMASDSASGSVSPWTWVEGRRNLDAYLKGNNNNQRAMIGQTEVPAGSTEDARLIINTSDSVPNHIMFKKGNDILGSMRFSSPNNITIDAFDLENTYMSSSRNVAVGASALKVNTIGSENVAVGDSTLKANTTGSNNVAVGASALKVNTTGSHNIAIGFASLGNTEGSKNIAMGYKALENNKEGSGNIAIGNLACANVTGSHKICIGSVGPLSAYPEASDDRCSIYIGSLADKVDIGSLLHIERGGQAKFSMVNELLVNGTPVQNITSDRRLKNVGKAYTSSLDKIRQLKPFNYTYKKDKKNTPHVGVIAQDLQKIFPNAVQKNDEGYLTIRQEDMFYAVINAIKELDAKITQLIETLKQVQSDIYALRQENKEIKKRLDALEKR